MKKKPDVKALRRRVFAAALGVTLSFAAFTGSAVLAMPEIPVDTSGVEITTAAACPRGWIRPTTPCPRIPTPLRQEAWSSRYRRNTTCGMKTL